MVDLTGVLFIDDEGKRVLRELHREGARFRTSGLLTESIVAEIGGRSRGERHGVWFAPVLILLVALSARAAQPDPQPAELLTLREGVELALKQNPQVQVANLNVTVTQESQIAARSALLPQANFGGSEA
ncbi:MAG TPA: hypothetical protein VME17_01125 [Bryobacteraceae bacterium]|nr:hypothetical protein [Bryobacteraceae bacterium]